MSLLSDASLITFLVLTVIIGGGAAFLAGSGAWRGAGSRSGASFSTMALLAGAVRFFHYALFDGTLTSPYYYLVTYLILAAFGSLGYRSMRTTQMMTQYRWLYERSSPLTWRHRHAKPVSH